MEQIIYSPSREVEKRTDDIYWCGTVIDSAQIALDVAYNELHKAALLLAQAIIKEVKQ